MLELFYPGAVFSRQIILLSLLVFGIIVVSASLANPIIFWKSGACVWMMIEIFCVCAFAMLAAIIYTVLVFLLN